MKIINYDPVGDKIIDEVVDSLNRGGVVILPTDTIYGLAVDAANQEAIDRVFMIKGRDKSHTLAIMVGGTENIYDYAVVGEMEKKYIEEFLPGPVTVILPANQAYLSNFSPDTVNSVGGIGIRVVGNEFVQEVCRRLGRPIALTSANKSKAGEYVADVYYVKKQLSDWVDDIDILIDAGHLGNNTPSMVVDLTKTPYEIIRYGGLAEKNNQ